jgi:hypothetical protein
MLRHPAYAGAYAYGRCPMDPTRRVAGTSKAGRRNAPPEEWVCLLRDKLPAYISWDQFEENRRRLAANDKGRGSKTTTGRAPTLLNGLLRCGRCGRPMLAHNARASAHPRYACDHEFAEYGGPRCQSVTAAYPDRLIEALVLSAVEPAAPELSLRAAERVEGDRRQLHAHWARRLERAEYEANRARRQYDAVDPENRLVARELERQWEGRPAERQRLEEEYARFGAERPRHLTAGDRDRIRALAADLPGLWHAGTTSGSDRRAIVRLLIERVELTRHGDSERVTVVVRWRGGPASRHEVARGLRRYASLDRYAELKRRVVELRGEGMTADRIAEVLDREGYRVPRGEGFTGHRVRQLFVRFGLSGTPPGVRHASDLPATDEWWLPALAAELAVKPIVVHRWRWSNWLTARQLRGENGRWIVRAGPAEMGRLRRLREFEVAHQGRRTPPAELTTPSG